METSDKAAGQKSPVATEHAEQSSIMEQRRGKLKNFFRTKGIYFFLHLVILAVSVYLIYSISVDTFSNKPFYEYRSFQHSQFWICVIFLADFFIEFFLSKEKWRYLRSHFIFFLVSIPYSAIIYYFDWHISREAAYMIRYIPLIRSGYILAIVVGWFSYSKATGLFFSYLIILLSTVYFASLTFYLFEFKVNPDVLNYRDALWWAAMDVTTVGSNIVPVTSVGRVLAVVVAALGMMMFPIFTVYITGIVTRHNNKGESKSNVIFLPDLFTPTSKASGPAAEDTAESPS